MTEAPMHTFVTGPLPKGVPEILERLRQTEGVVQIAVMPDVHLASEFCVGTVVASDRYLFPNAVGGDIGCGMLAMAFDGSADTLEDSERAGRLLGTLEQLCPPRRHHRRTAPTSEVVPEITLSHDHLTAELRGSSTMLQLGTLGAGNHFLEFQRDEQHRLWLMIHTGSRHLGQVIYHHHLAAARKLPTQVLAIDADSAAGRAYYDDVQQARRWSRENRRLLALAAARAVASVLRISPLPETLFDCDHNHLQREVHGGRELFVHRKGATAAHEEEPGIIPGSMATRSYHTRGRGAPAALCSSSHGAGRLLSRTQARAQISRRQFREQLVRAGLWYSASLEEALREESPKAYKPIETVMEAQRELTTAVRTLHPLLVHKGA